MILNYNEKLWTKYTKDNASQKNPSKFIYVIIKKLGAKSCLEVGCNIGNNLEYFPLDFDVYGIDLNKYALGKAKKRFPTFDFRISPVYDIPFDDKTFDIVFTRTVLIHIPENLMKKVMDEMYRVSKKWIFNIEFYNENETMIDWSRGKDLLWYRNMRKRWGNYDVKILSDTDIPKKIDIDSTRITLVEKS